jgi:hypothetical protein
MKFNVFQKMGDIVRAHGVSGLARRSIAYAYRQGLRPYIPYRPVYYAGIPIFYRKWGDQIVPTSWIPNWIPTDVVNQPEYEATLLAGLSETTRPGDNVVVVGGGLGVTVVVAALRTGASGTVQCFEGSAQYAELIRQTAARKRITNVSVHHAVIAKSMHVNSGHVGPILAPSQLPSCDVLELDCEGAEVQILQEMTIHPRVVLVETHGLFGAPTNFVASLLHKHGYVVSDRGPAEAGDFCITNDIHVLLGIKSNILE